METSVQVVKVPNRRRYKLLNRDGSLGHELMPTDILEKAFIHNLEVVVNEDGDIVLLTTPEVNTTLENKQPIVDIRQNELDIECDYFRQCGRFKPDDLIISNLHWRMLVRNVKRGKNTLMLGGTGSGKTTAAKAVADALNRPFFKIPLGSSQDPRATLIGNMGFHPEKGTFFKEAEFVRAIQTENAVILIDELSRAHPDAENILIPVLDHQKYLKLDEHEDQPIINVAKGVSFIATANIGNEYSTTRRIDRASMDRYIIIEMPYISKDDQIKLLKNKFPLVDQKKLITLTKITDDIRKEYEKEDTMLSNMVSTRMAEEIAEALQDGFTLQEAFEVTVYPLFDKDGGGDSERTKVKNIVDKHLPATVEDQTPLPNNPFEKI